MDVLLCSSENSINTEWEQVSTNLLRCIGNIGRSSSNSRLAFPGLFHTGIFLKFENIEHGAIIFFPISVKRS